MVSISWLAQLECSIRDVTNLSCILLVPAAPPVTAVARRCGLEKILRLTNWNQSLKYTEENVQEGFATNNSRPLAANDCISMYRTLEDECIPMINQ